MDPRLNRPKPMDGMNRSRNLMLKDRSYASRPSASDKVLSNRPIMANIEVSYACQSVNSNYNNPFIPILPRIADPPPAPVAVTVQRPPMPQVPNLQMPPK
uniref:Ovule protein n=1 Tax=Panagrellus redivivus TaxID=6233 RepID=A0A7E4WAK2_PANRE